MSFRLAESTDEELVLELMREFYEIERLNYDREVARGALRELWRDPYLGRVYLIHSASQPAGYVVLTFGFSLEFHGRDALVDELYVRETFRGQGLGRTCLQGVESICREEGIKALHLQVDHTNISVGDWYRRFGFSQHDRHFMTKWLGR